ncbi:MAG: 4-hydroxy-tetrahydrodipicolinate reductase [Dehalococcoidia bacterium]|nr:4-hydroxy-tetrahydrodipicolinate reductase [Dehalococcoidia bacterium]MCA9854501.1 4-hydroxy-tetrahydrodipicolinate reductase [Dehalococcoidia bacterium]
MAIEVAVSGSGKMGREVAAAVAGAPDMEFRGFIDALAPYDEVDDAPVYRSPGECFEAQSCDVVVDFTNATFTPKLVEAALAAGVRPVIGTSGLPSEWVEQLRQTCAKQKTGAVLAANFAIGAVLMMQFAKQAAPFFDNVEIIELHHDQKVDAPSGTAMMTAEMMRAARSSRFTHPDTERYTLEGSRGAEYEGIAIHSVRLRGLVAHQEVLMGAVGQTLTIRHDSTGRDSFMPGVLLAVREVMHRDSLTVGLESLLGIG